MSILIRTIVERGAWEGEVRAPSSLSPSLPPPSFLSELILDREQRGGGAGPRKPAWFDLSLAGLALSFLLLSSLIVRYFLLLLLLFLRMRFPSLKYSSRHDVSGDRRKANNKNSSNDKKRKQTNTPQVSVPRTTLSDVWRWKLATCYLFTQHEVP